MSLQNLLTQLEALGKRINTWDTVIQIGYVPTPDAIIAASIFGSTFLSNEHPFTLFQLDLDQTYNKTRLSSNCIFIGLASQEFDFSGSEVDYIVLEEPSIETQPSDNVFNPGNYGYLRPEVSLSSLAYLICDSLLESISHIIHLPLVAAQFDDPMGEYRGINDIIAQHAITEKMVTIEKDLAILGANIFSISEAIQYSHTPFLPGLTGNERQVTKLLAKAGIVVETSEGARKLEDLDENEIKELNSKLVVFLAEYKGHQEAELVFIKPKSVFSRESTSLLNNNWDFAQVIQDGIYRNKIGVLMQMLLGNRSSSLQELTKIFREERNALTSSFGLIFDKQEEVVELQALRYLTTSSKINWYNASLVAAMGLSNGLVTVDLPFAIVCPGPDDLTTIGVRASKQHGIGRPLVQLIEEVLTEHRIATNVVGSNLSSQFSLPDNKIESVLHDLNSKLSMVIS